MNTSVSTKISAILESQGIKKGDEKDQIILSALSEILLKTRSAHTARAYRTDIETYVSWCHVNNRAPFPIEEESVLNFVLESANEFKFATVERRLHALGAACAILKMPSPVRSDSVTSTMHLLRKFQSNDVKHAKPMSEYDFQTLLSINQNWLNTKDFAEPCDVVKPLRAQVFLLLARETLAKRNELTDMRFEDVCKYQHSDTFAIQVRGDNSRIVDISKELVELLKSLSQVIGQNKGPILRGLKRNGVFRNRPITGASLLKLLYELEENACLSQSGFNVESIRLGGALHDYLRGIAIDKIMARGGWKDAKGFMKLINPYLPEEKTFTGPNALQSVFS